MRLVLATRNCHKLRELGYLLAPHEVLALPDSVELPPEGGSTFADNALAKARAAGLATGATVVADDSGIEAAALGGAPGVRSARYAGETATDGENLTKLLREVPANGDTRVAYVCALALVWAGGGEDVVEGRCEGWLTHDPRGEGGFGYDPAFVPDEAPWPRVRSAGRSSIGRAPEPDPPTGRTMAELTREEKDAISHRGRAARALLARLQAGAE